jgi:undecaprenyl-diphosphatase
MIESGSILEAIILGVAQGVAEFLPISSSGHLIILRDLLNGGGSSARTNAVQLSVALHLGTLFSILVVFRSEVLKLFHQPRLCLAIFVACIPAGIVGLFFRQILEEYFWTSKVAGIALCCTAVFLFVARKIERNEHDLEDCSNGSAFAIGLFQAIALIPGISRSGSTIAAGLMTGLKREAAATFSFLIAIPVIGGAALIEGIKIARSPAIPSLPPLMIGMLTSFVVGFFALRCLLKIVSARKLHWFAYYCLIVGVSTIVWKSF